MKKRDLHFFKRKKNSTKKFFAFYQKKNNNNNNERIIKLFINFIFTNTKKNKNF